MNFLEVHHISKFEGERPILKDISLVLKPKQKLALMGETGSGKSSLMKIIAGFLKAEAGTVMFEGNRVPGPDEVLIPGQIGIAYLSQHFELRNNYRVIELLEMASQLNDKEAGRIFKICQIEHLLQRMTNQLSGGERQRIALSRLLITKPRLLLLDEPFTNLDTFHKNIINQVIHQISDELGITCMLVSHDPVDVLSWADELILIKDGIILQQGSPKEVYYSPINEYAAGVLGNYNLLNENHASIANELGLGNPGIPLFIRPEQFIISDKKENTILAIVVKILFCGSYLLIHVNSNGTNLIIQTQNQSLSIGDAVYVSVNC
jgi:ABC-type sugar transport system ATPase subunit